MPQKNSRKDLMGKEKKGNGSRSDLCVIQGNLGAFLRLMDL